MVIYVNLLLVILIAVSLSMDAFSLSLAYGVNNLSKKDCLSLSLSVGVFHFIMPIIGMLFGNILLNIIKIRIEIIVFIIFMYIGINMFIEVFKNDNDTSIKNIFDILLFAFAVSLDSFSIGIGIRGITNNIILSCLLFTLFSFIFTYIGLNIGSKLYYRLGKLANIIGSIILIVLSFIYMFK